MPSTKNKSQIKKTYMKFLISKETTETEKKVKKLAIKEVKEMTEPEINTLTKQIVKAKNKVQTYIDILENIDNPHYIEMLGEEFQTLEQMEQFMMKEIPENMTVIDPESGPKHLLIEQKIPLLKSKENIWTYISDSIEESIKDTEFIWNAFRIEEVIQMQDPSSNNQKKIIQKTIEHLESLYNTHGIDMRFCIPPNCYNLKTIIENTVKAYTGSFYTVINMASTSKDIVILRGIRYLFQILIKNYRLKIFGSPLLNKVTLYRNISLAQDLFNLYKKNGIIYFTNLTSASKKNLHQFGGAGSPGMNHVTFLIQLLYYSEQKSNRFYSGLDIADKSHYKAEQEVLIFPFQFFMITHIQQKSVHQFEIHLQEIKSKAVIQKMQEPIKKNVKKCSFNAGKLKKTMQKITETHKSVIEEKIAAKAQLVEEFKQKLLQISQKEYFVTQKSGLTSNNPDVSVIGEDLFQTILQNQTHKEINQQMIQIISHKENKEEQYMIDQIQQEPKANPQIKQENVMKQEQITKKLGQKKQTMKQAEPVKQKKKEQKTEPIKEKQKDTKLTKEKEKTKPVKEKEIESKPVKEKEIEKHVKPMNQQQIKQKQTIFQAIVEQKKQKQKEKIDKIKQIAKQCKSFNQILSKMSKSTQNIESTYNITQTEVEFKNEMVINQVIDSVSKEDEQKSDEKIHQLQEKIKKNKISFEHLKVRTNTEVNHKEYIIMVLQEAFKIINQKTIILESLPTSLYKFYIERMTVGDINKFIYKFYFYAKKTQQEIKETIEMMFKQKYFKSGQYIKITMEKQGKMSIGLIESSQDYEAVSQIIKEAQGKEYLNLIKGLAAVKHSNLVYCDEMLDNRGNNDYIHQTFPMQLRGRQDYHFPNGTLRIGIRVWDAYENNNWMTMNNSAGQWPVVYTSFAQTVINEAYYGLTNDNPVSAKLYPKISQNAINCTADFDVLRQYLSKVLVNGQYLHVGFQCRVDPNELQYSYKNKKYCYIDRSKSKSIRPYGILIRKA